MRKSIFILLTMLLVVLMFSVMTVDAHAQKTKSVTDATGQKVIPALTELEKAQLVIMQKDYLINQQQLKLMQAEAAGIRKQNADLEDKFEATIGQFRKAHNVPAEWQFDPKLSAFSPPPSVEHGANFSPVLPPYATPAKK